MRIVKNGFISFLVVLMLLPLNCFADSLSESEIKDCAVQVFQGTLLGKDSWDIQVIKWDYISNGEDKYIVFLDYGNNHTSKRWQVVVNYEYIPSTNELRYSYDSSNMVVKGVLDKEYWFEKLAGEYFGISDVNEEETKYITDWNLNGLWKLVSDVWMDELGYPDDLNPYEEIPTKYTAPTVSDDTLILSNDSLIINYEKIYSYQLDISAHGNLYFVIDSDEEEWNYCDYVLINENTIHYLTDGYIGIYHKE